MEEKTRRGRTASDRLDKSEQPGIGKDVRVRSIKDARPGRIRTSEDRVSGSSTAGNRIRREMTSEDKTGRESTAKVWKKESTERTPIKREAAGDARIRKDIAKEIRIRREPVGRDRVRRESSEEAQVKRSSAGGERIRREFQGRTSIRKGLEERDRIRREPETEDWIETEAEEQEQSGRETEIKAQGAGGSIKEHRRIRNQASRKTGNRRIAGRRPQSRRRRKRNLIIKAGLLVILVIAVVAGAFLWKKYSPSKEKADTSKYYGIEKEGQLAITIDNQIVEPYGMISESKAYVQYEIVRDYINSRFYWDPNENILLYTLPKDMVTVEVGSKDYTISKDTNSEDYVILKTEGSTAYIALDFVQKYTNIEYEVYDDPKRVMIVTDWGKTTVAEVRRNTQVRYKGGIKSPVLTEISKKDEVTVIESEGKWKKVRTKDGFIGYVKNNALRDEETKKISRDFEEQEFTNISKDYTINMAWHNVTNSSANNSVLERIASTKGLTTIAPTWYHVKNTDGDLESISSKDYVNYAHQSNIEVWATVRDFDGGIDSAEESLAMLSSTSKRENLINQLIAEALKTGIDGINVDFEKVSEECGEHYIQFIRELSVRCRQNGLVLSVDNYVPKGYNMQYNRKEQGIVADYVIIMGYDEYYAGSPEAGPVSSYNFVKEGVEETLKEVPAEKVISGIPFFTRLWQEAPKTEEELAEDAGTDNAAYSTKVTSEAFSMSGAKEKVSQSGAEITWDEEAMQDYATWTADDTTYKIWLENEKSIEPKLEIMKENKLAGTAAWALGQETSDIWQLILKYVN